MTPSQKDLTMIVDETVEYINALENTNHSVSYYQLVKDIEGEQNYVYIKLDIGYVIITNEGIISEYYIGDDRMPYSTNENNLIYGGPQNYFSELKPIPISSYKSSDFNNLVIRNKQFLIETKNKPSDKKENNLTNDVSWKGISESRFAKYGTSQWINNHSNFPPSKGYPSGGICGTISAAMLLSYYDDYVSDLYVPSSIRTRHSTSPHSLITSLYPYIDKGRNGTLPHHVGSGINSWATDRGIPYEMRAMNIGPGMTFLTAKNRIDNKRPILIGLLAILGSNYGDHWVIAYQYTGTIGLPNDLYKVADNHGKYNAAINIGWSAGHVSINY